MEVILKYTNNGPDGEYEISRAKTAINAEVYKNAFEEVWDRCFRPNNKHGYPIKDSILNDEASYEVIEAISEIYNEVRSNMECQLSE